LIDEKENYIAVADLMNHSRYYAVNFLNLYYGRIGTVEYRMAPASNGPFESLGWIELFTAFTRAALLVRSRLTQYGRDVSGLKSFLEAGDIEGVTLPTVSHHSRRHFRRSQGRQSQTPFSWADYSRTGSHILEKTSPGQRKGSKGGKVCIIASQLRVRLICAGAAVWEGNVLLLYGDGKKLRFACPRRRLLCIWSQWAFVGLGFADAIVASPSPTQCPLKYTCYFSELYLVVTNNIADLRFARCEIDTRFKAEKS
jgi:hypothetical protein